MQQIIVEVLVPATSEEFDFRLPASARIGDVIGEMIRTLEATRQNLRFDAEYPMLCDRRAGRVLRRGDTVAGAGLRDGAQLILV